MDTIDTNLRTKKKIVGTGSASPNGRALCRPVCNIVFLIASEYENPLAKQMGLYTHSLLPPTWIVLSRTQQSINEPNQKAHIERLWLIALHSLDKEHCQVFAGKGGVFRHEANRAGLTTLNSLGEFLKKLKT